ncbi:cytochrome c biogenesis protein CcsA [Persephonella sp.]
MSILKKVADFLFSLKFTIVLLIIFGAVIGAATFIENDFGRETSYALIYGTRWFELLLTLLALNLTGNIFRYKMWKPKKIPLFVFHLSFIVIFIGAAVTRYFGYEGMMHIREKQEQNQIFSRDPFLQISAKKGNKEFKLEKPLLLSAVPVFNVNNFEEKIEIEGKPLIVRYKNFIKGVTTDIKEDPNGEPIITLRASAGMDSVDLTMKEGSVEDFGSFAFIFSDPEKFKKRLEGKDFVFFFVKENKFYLLSNLPVQWMKMADRSQGMIKAGNEFPLQERTLYSVGGLNFVIRKAVVSGKEVVVPLPRTKDILKNSSVLSALFVEVEYDGDKVETALLGRGGSTPGIPKNIKIKDLDLKLEWGAKVITLPFYIYLKDFVMRKYPGSNKPSSYESHVIVKDPVNKKEFEYNIHMNHPLVYGGYKFFQSSYDPDEKGTVLSVNHDPGVIPTYIGYGLMFLGLFLNLLNPFSRFGRTLKMLNKDTAKAILILISILSFSYSSIAYPGMQSDQSSQKESVIPQKPNMEEIINTVKKLDKKHAEKFGTLAVQSGDGRIEPVDTLALEVVNKIHGGPSVLGMTHNQVLLGMFLMPGPWQYVKMIKVKHPAIKKMLGIPMEDKYFAFIDAYDEKGMYKLAQAVESARRKDPSQRNQFEKELLKIDEKLYICYLTFTGEILRLFPKENDPNNTWYGPRDALKTFPQRQREEVATILSKYIHGVQKGLKEGKWDAANMAIEDIKDFQKRYGYKVLPSETRLKAEILYNKLMVFERLTPFYFFIGFLSIILIFIQIFKPNSNVQKFGKIIVVLLAIAFLVHTAGLGLRWYVAGHAPWTDAYESMLFISWAVALAGIVFARKSLFVLASVGIFAGVFLFAAHLGWLDPQITTVVPVLKSYWLLIHVSVLTASYGFLGLAAILGIISLIFFAIKYEKLLGKERVVNLELGIKEATKISELSLIIGLSLIISGNFLGAIWANESWGRYWGWDPKETWTAVSIAVYAAIVHLKYIPSWYSYYKMAVFSVLGYFAVLMTYFGVNYYLSGLHSYAAGDPVPIPTWVYWAVGFLAVLIAAAYKNRKLKT